MKTILAFLLALALATIAHASTSYPEITLEQLKAAMANKKVLLLDANGTDTWQKGHIPGAIDFAAEKGKLSTVLPKDKGALIVAYCMCVGCPYYLSAANASTKLGYTNVRHFAPGIYGWREAGEKIAKGS